MQCLSIKASRTLVAVTRLRFANRANRFLSWGCNRKAHRIFGAVFMFSKYTSIYCLDVLLLQKTLRIPAGRLCYTSRRYPKQSHFFLFDRMVYTVEVFNTVFTVQSTNQKNNAQY